MFCREDELAIKHGRYISELLACARQNTQYECLKNKRESRSAKHFSVRTTEQMVCICDFPFTSWKLCNFQVKFCYVICDFLFILCSLISEN